MTSKIFISYASPDRARAEDVYHLLVREGFEPWMDKKNLKPGQRWEVGIRRAIRDADLIIVCLSNSAVDKRGYFQKEIREALSISDEKLDDDIFLIPLRLEPCIVPDRLGNFQYISIFEPGAEQLLAQTIRDEAEKRRQSPVGHSLGEGYQGPIVTFERYTQSVEGFPGYDIDITIPSISRLGDAQAEREVSAILAGFIWRDVGQFRAASIEQWDARVREQTHPPPVSSITYDCDVLRMDHHIVSIALNAYYYNAGTPHPNGCTYAFNFWLPPVRYLDLHDIFSDGYLEFISRACFDRIVAQEQYKDIDREWLRSGLEPATGNFSSFGLTADSFVFFFPPYQLASYATGPFQVSISFADATPKLTNSELVRSIRDIQPGNLGHYAARQA